ncbi:MAG: trigger factor [Patescibacteria group bacterium]|jgi:trigger factor
MKITKKDLDKGQVELNVVLEVAEFTPYLEKGAKKISETVKIEGFRPGKAPLEIVKQQVGEMTVLEEAANIAIRKTIDQVMEENLKDQETVGQPQIEITKLAPGNDLEYKVTVALMPEVTLGKYKGLEIKKPEIKIPTTDIDKSVAELQELRATEILSEKESKVGDRLMVDVEMFLGKVPLEGGQTQDLAVIIGKNHFVPGFDEKLLGVKSGETVEFDLDFPKEHHQKNIAGKKVTFKVKVKSVYERQLPEINDDLATGFNFKDLNDLRKALEENMVADKERQQANRLEVEMIDKIIDDSKFGEIPEVMINNETHYMIHEIEDDLKRQGGTLTDYLAHLGKNQQEFTLELVPSALKRVKASLVIKQIAKTEKVEIKEEEISDKIAELKAQHPDNEDLKNMATDPSYRRYVKSVMENAEVLKRLKEWNYASTGDQQKS